MTVSDLSAALDFWQRFLPVQVRWRTTLDRPYLGRNVGYPGVRIDAAFVDFPDGTVLELLDYQDVERTPIPEQSANPGHNHFCLAVDDIDAACERAIAAGARMVYPDGPQEIDGGPNRGARAVYLRIPPDDASVELFQPPPATP